MDKKPSGRNGIDAAVGGSTSGAGRDGGVKSPEFKAQIALEALVGLRSAADLARLYQVSESSVRQWKKKLKDGLPRIFESGDVNDSDPGFQRNLIQSIPSVTGTQIRIERKLDQIEQILKGMYREG